MSNNIGKFIFFAAGLVLGSVVTWKVTKTKYERIAQEEIDSVKAVYSRKAEKLEKEIEQPKKTEETVYRSDVYKGLVSNYNKAFDATNIEEEGDAEESDGPYVISPEEFDENGYETVSLTYFADKVLIDDDWDVVTDLDGTIGRDSLNHFGEFEDDSVFVRNDKLRIDYEILLDTRNYSDIKLESASWYP